MVTEKSVTLYQRLYWSWVSVWDSAHYVSIATEGYKFPQQAFFPLWPLLIKIVSLTGISPFIASFILSIIFGLSTFILFYILAVKLIGKPSAKYALILFVSFPSTMFLHAGYTEGLFLTLTLLSFLMMERKSYLLSAIFAGFSTMARLTGVGVIAIFLTLRQPVSQKLFLLFISLSGLIIYMLFLQFQFGNWLLFVDAQKAWCQSQGRCQFIFPLTPLLEYGRLVAMGWVKPTLDSPFLDWSASVIFLVMSTAVFKKFKLDYFIYSLVVILLPLFSSTVGMIRYVLVAFPIFFVIPVILRFRWLLIILIAALFLLELRFVMFFTSGLWVA